jgi:uncharacterized membrane protein (UPF0127 family)
MFNKKTMSTFWLAIIGGIILVAFIGLKIFTDHLPEAYVHINDKDLYVMVADTPSRWFKGLSGRKNLGIYDGMLFVFPDASRRTMVMRDMDFALDVVWIKDSKIIDVKQNLLPEPGKKEAELTHYSPADSADMVIELVGGYVAQNGIKVGDDVKVDVKN